MMRTRHVAHGLVALVAFGALLIGGALSAEIASAAPARALPSGGENAKTTLNETSIDGPALWSIATAPSGENPTFTNGIAWTGTDPQHHLNLEYALNGLNYDSAHKLTLGETSFARPSVAWVGPETGVPGPGAPGVIALAWTGTDPQHHLNVLYDVYGARRKLTLDETSPSSPSIAANGATLVIAWEGTDANHSLNVRPIAVSTAGGGATLTPQPKTTLGYRSANAPTVAYDPHNNGQWLLTWTDAAQPPYINYAVSLDGRQWRTPLVAPPPQTSVAGPSMLATIREPSGAAPYYWAWTGADPRHSLNIIGTSAFPNWPAPVTTLSESAIGGPSLGFTGGQGSSALLAWTGTDAAHHLNVALVQP